VGYEVPAGRLADLGAFVETALHGDFRVDNANLLKSPGHAVVDVNAHSATELSGVPEAHALQRGRA
jgi:iron complex outermembrane receptor protein